jgi:hypothetical protein
MPLHSALCSWSYNQKASAKRDTSYNILNYTTLQLLLGFVMNVPDQGLVQMFPVNVLSQFFSCIDVSFLYYNFNAICPSSAQ